MADRRPSEEQKEPVQSIRPYFHEEEEIEISLKELLVTLIRGKKVIAWFTAASMVLFLFAGIVVPHIQIGTKGTVQTAVKLYFSGIELGQTPTGSTYDVNEIKSAEILQGAIDNMDLGSKTINLEDLKENLSFQAVVPDSVAKTMEDLKEIKDDEVRMEQLKNLKGSSDVYIIKLNLSNALGINEEEGRALLDNLILVYKQQLIQKYGEQAALANVFKEDFSLEKYDYIQAADILNDQLERMEIFVRLYMPQTNTQSTVTGMNPQDIASALASIRSVDMERIYTNIAAFYLAQDTNKAVAIYEQLAQDKEKEAAQYGEEAAAIKKVVAEYKKDDQTIVLGNAGSAPIQLTTENEQYNKFVTQYIEAGTKAANAAEDAAYYQAEAERFKAAPAQSAAGSEADNTAESILLLKDKLVYWTEMMNETAQDYYNQVTYQRYAEQLMPAREYRDLGEDPSLIKLAGIGLAMGFIIGTLVVLFRAYLKEELLKKEETEASDDE